jgi:predicted nucleotide-binding protein
LQLLEIVVPINRAGWQRLISIRALLRLAVDKLKDSTVSTNRKAVMVIAGHDREANAALLDWLRAIGLQPLEWSQLVHSSGNASPYNGEILELAFQNVQAVIAFFTPDEYVLGRANWPGDIGWRLQARPNVLIEAGMALVAHPRRTVLTVLGAQELPSDLAGRYYIRLTHASPEPLLALANCLQDAGCDVDLTGADWLNHEHFPDRDHIPRPAAIPGDGHP